MSAKKTKIVLVISALVLFVLLFIAPKTEPKQEEGSSTVNPSETKGRNKDATIAFYLDMALKSLDSKQKQKYNNLTSLGLFDSLAVFWNTLKRPDLSAFALEALANKTKTAENWFIAGNRYYYSVPFTKDKNEEPILYQCAMRCFERGIALNSNNVDAKIMLASCFVESGINPMEGINQLKEIEKTDSLNAKLQLTFAFFSVKSGQTDKAISRFQKVLMIDPNYIEAYLHLADAFEQKGETEKTIQMLELYSSKTDDVTARLEINKYIEQLKRN